MAEDTIEMLAMRGEKFIRPVGVAHGTVSRRRGIVFAGGLALVRTSSEMC